MKLISFGRLSAAALLSGLLWTLPVCGQLYSDDFNTDSSANYRVLEFSSVNDEVLFAFDYSTLGIPEAPNSTAGGTTGVVMRANNPPGGGTGATSAVQIVPIGLGMALPDKDYRVTADLWMNVNGPLPAGGGGSTEAFMFGVGFNAATGLNAIEIGTISGTYFTITGDGGASTDVRSFTNDGFNAPGINQGPSGNSADPYYTGIFPGGVDVGALPVQGGMGNQTGVTAAGQMGFAWHELRIDKIGTQVDFYVDDLLIARDTDADVEGNVVLGYGDYFASVSDAPQWSFGLYDNFVVAEITAGIDGDFNDDGAFDCLDVDPLVASIVSGADDPAFDLTADGQVNADDLAAWLVEGGNAEVGGPFLSGDANLDGVVDVSDFNVWNGNKFSATPAFCSGDFNADGSVDVSDFNNWNGNKFQASGRPATVPEPQALLLLVLGVFFIGRTAHRRGRH